MRHYAIRANPVGITKGIKKLVQGKIANLGELQDISEYVESGGAGLLSDSEAEDEESKIVLPDRFNGKGNFESQQSAMKLTELGPRMTLELFKVESGLGEGDVLYHKYVQKSVEEAAALKQRVESQRALKEERRRIQEENVKRKRQLEEEKIQLKLERKRQKYGDKDGNVNDTGSVDESLEDNENEDIDENDIDNEEDENDDENDNDDDEIDNIEEGD
eukprot:CAMPEP_0196766234 /NCGR_PEP_ID=MMETSP1095-20130614/20877_1 /TAXON_ID=96789 ORGANISM="Chromulina nebulosa, Strain UTEXLB2642" /NCGR_SAMPLE_ID=MMETSP1095 /ASSEMBLY_ACC=CAM_ASM_000446 /LENGTH=217 /DNA_ID=CAMNT_0042127071 /DNA_START=323 /DNA_END=973 /DNA_ORIENTATION=+